MRAQREIKRNFRAFTEEDDHAHHQNTNTASSLENTNSGGQQQQQDRFENHIRNQRNSSLLSSSQKKDKLSSNGSSGAIYVVGNDEKQQQQQQSKPAAVNKMPFVGVLDQDQARAFTMRSNINNANTNNRRGTASFDNTNNSNNTLNNFIQKLDQEHQNQFGSMTISNFGTTAMDLTTTNITGATTANNNNILSHLANNNNNNNSDELTALKMKCKGVMFRELGKSHERKQREQEQLQRDAKEVENWMVWHREVESRERAMAEQRRLQEQREARRARRKRLREGGGSAVVGNEQQDQQNDNNINHGLYDISDEEEEEEDDITTTTSDDDEKLSQQDEEYEFASAQNADDVDSISFSKRRRNSLPATTTAKGRERKSLTFLDNNDDDIDVVDDNDDGIEDQFDLDAELNEEDGLAMTMKKLRRNQAQSFKMIALVNQSQNSNNNNKSNAKNDDDDDFSDDDDGLAGSGEENEESLQRRKSRRRKQQQRERIRRRRKQQHQQGVVGGTKKKINSYLDAEEELLNVVRSRLDFRVAVTNMIVCEHEENKERHHIMEDAQFIWDNSLMRGFAEGHRKTQLIEISRGILLEMRAQRKEWLQQYVDDLYGEKLGKKFLKEREKIRQHDLFLLFESLEDESLQSHLMSLSVGDRERFLDDLAVERFLKAKVNGLRKQKHSVIV